MNQAAVPIVFHPRRDGALARLGDAMARHRRAILAAQWAIVLFYAALVVLPAFFPHPHAEARAFASDLAAASAVDSLGATAAHAKTPYLAPWHERLVLFAQYLFWGVWWPFVIVSVILFGRLWCGVLCPEGTLAEFASRHGRGGAIPRWLRWGGWPVLAFIVTTVYGQLISVYEYAQAALLILGGSTLVAVAIGWLYGRGKRVWCRYLCPVSGVFALLARLSPFYFAVDRTAWESHKGRTAAIDCAPLLDVKHMKGAAQCHACGRCSGHREAVTLATRWPGAEILAGDAPRTSDAMLLMFGMLGVAIGAFQWTVSPWFVMLKQRTAEWLVERELLWPLEDSPAWWLLTRHPEAGDVFTWLDGAAVLVYIAGVALLLGGVAWIAIALAARVARLDWRRLALALTPLAGIGLFLGLSMMSVNHLRAEGVLLPWLGFMRGGLLALGVGWSLGLGIAIVTRERPGFARAAFAGLTYALPLAMVATVWGLMFYVW